LTVTDGGTTVPLSKLLAQPELGLRLLTRADAQDREISGARTSELIDPTGFLSGGELLLLAGENLPEDEEAQLDYVFRLAAAGVGAVGFGVGRYWDEVPLAVRAAAGQAGLPLLEVPRSVPFLAVTRAVAAAIDRRFPIEDDQLMRAERALTVAAVGQGDPASVLDELVRLTGGWALLLDEAGSMLAASPESAAHVRRGAIGADLERLRGSSVATSVAISDGDADAWVHSLHAEGEVLGLLAVGRSEPLGPLERRLVNVAVSLCTVLVDRSRAADQRGRRLRAAALRLLFSGQLPAVAEVAGELWNGMPAEPLAVLVCQGGPGPLASTAERLANDRALARVRVLFGELDDEGLVCVCSAGGRSSAGTRGPGARTSAGARPSADERNGAGRPGGLGANGTPGSGAAGSDIELLVRVLRGVEGLRIGVSEPAEYATLGRARDEALRAASYGAGSDTVVTWFREVPRIGLLSLLPGETAAEFSTELLRPLRAEQSGSAGATRGDLVHSLRAWLAHHGQWDPAAAELGVHRHTLRNRMHKVELLLGRELDSADLRAELWLALRLDERRKRPQLG
jgi:purine catabolism regulator